MIALTRVLVVSLIVLLAPTAAHAQDGEGATPGGIGVGAEAMLTGWPDWPGGLAVIYDAGAFHIDGMLSFVDAGNSRLGLGGRFLYHIHSSDAADFSIGGGLGLVHWSYDGDRNDETDFVVEGLVQLRAFIVSNVALSASAGVAALVADEDGDDLFLISGDLVGTVGVAYYFF